MTAEALLYYAVGLWAVSGGRILASTFYALQDTSTPVKIAVLSLFGKIVLSLLLMGPMRHGGLALATSLASGINLLLLIWALKKRLGRIGGRDMVRSAGKAVAAAVLMGIIIVVATQRIWTPGTWGIWGLLISVFGAVSGGAVIYLGLACLFRCPEVVTVMDMVKTSIRRTAR
jgi:putative peptidoglycan lipid II flippase